MKDKEKQICKYCGKPIKSAETKTIKERIADYDGNYFCSCNKENQIEEMAIEDIVKIYPEISRPTAFGIINILKFKYGESKLPEDSVVWTMTEHAKLVAQVRDEFEHEYKDKVILSRERYDYLTVCFDKFVEIMEDVKKLERKETAEKFINLPKSKILTVVYDYEEIKVVELKELQELAKQFGVEIKEQQGV